jgi:hypothetical protein
MQPDRFPGSSSLSGSSGSSLPPVPLAMPIILGQLRRNGEALTASYVIISFYALYEASER